MSAPQPKALLAQARRVDDAWNAWMSDEDDDEGPLWEEVIAAILALRQVLQGTRALRMRTDSYGYVRPRCLCGWPGSPWQDESIWKGGHLMTKQELAAQEFSNHICYLPPEES